MRSVNTCLLKIITLLFIAFIFNGCTHVLKSSDLPKLQTGSPLKSVSPKIFAFKEFTDNRPYKKVLDEMGVHTFVLDQPASIVVAEAIKQEFERNGHTCILYSPQSKTDFIVEGEVLGYYVDERSGTWFSESIGTVEVRLTLSHPLPIGGTFSKVYVAKKRFRNSVFKAVKEPIREAHLIMLKQISYDMELVDFLNK